MKVANINDIPEGEAKSFNVGGEPVAVFRREGKFYAIGNACPHQGGPLVEGSVSDGVVICPWHGWRFSLETGKNPEGMPFKVPSYEVRIEGEEIHLERKT